MTPEDIGRNSVLLSGIVGSTAYGLNHPGSDIDYLGVYGAPTSVFHGLFPPTEKESSIVRKEPDFTLHEAGKFARLCLSGNPTVLELLWLTEYETITPLGKDLIGIRDSFLSAKKVRDAYLGYATQQFDRLAKRDGKSFSADTKVSKHARHLFRLLHQGYHLYASGSLVIKLDRPEAFIEFGNKVEAGDLDVARDLIAFYEECFNNVISVLPEEPDLPLVESWLQRVRTVHL